MNENTPTILLVEDNEDDVYVMRRALHKGHIKNPVQLATDGEQAVEYLAGNGVYANRKEHPLPFIIFLDIKLPFLDGFEVLSWMQHQDLLDKIVVVMLTSSGLQEDRERAHALGARSYIVKPPSAQELLEVLQSLKSYWISKLGVYPVVSNGSQGDTSNSPPKNVN